MKIKILAIIILGLSLGCFKHKTESVMEIKSIIEELSLKLPDPFFLKKGLDEFYNQPHVKGLLKKAKVNAPLILDFLAQTENTLLSRTSVLILAKMDTSLFYRKALNILAKSSMTKVESFETGIWLFNLPEEQIAKDIVDVVDASGSPHPLLLLQRPVSKVVKHSLKTYVMQYKQPLSLYALYCYDYILEVSDIPFLQEVSQKSDNPELTAVAISLLRKLEVQVKD